MKRFGFVAFVDQISKVAVSVYVMDILSITLTTIGFRFPKMWKISEIYAKFACTYRHYCIHESVVRVILNDIPLTAIALLLPAAATNRHGMGGTTSVGVQEDCSLPLLSRRAGRYGTR